MSEQVVDVYADGACRGNPGRGGWGVTLQVGSSVKELYGGEALTTNNRMELTAVIRALEALKRPATVRIHTKSGSAKSGGGTPKEIPSKRVTPSKKQASEQGGKGRPTPSRKESEANRTSRPSNGKKRR
jgi:ribonuclease HI